MATTKLQTLSKKERQDANREQKRKSAQARYRSRTAKQILIGGLGLAIVSAAVGLIWFTSRGAELGQTFPNKGQEHIAVGAAHLPYNSNPPTSGPHYLQPAAWGIYQAELPDEVLIHNLEHGGIWISYNNIDQTTKQRIEALAKEHPDKMIVTPRVRDNAKIVLASWRHLLKLDTFDEETVISFIKANKNRSPEPTAM